jgi:hypothetical protein
MFDIEDIDPLAAPAEASSRGERQRASDDIARINRRKKADPLANTVGLIPAYMRRAGDKKLLDDAAAAAPVVEAPPPDPSYVMEIDPSVDAGTLRMRERITLAGLAIEPVERLPRYIAWPMLAVLSMLIWIGMGGLIFGWDWALSL